ncbi:MAG: carbohydrate-binding domain-containing protein, partial [Oscillospiraceae bacterium]|nr:carbohydrate-binding domain-containing protein [Oscillospiraceae bacterium]
TESITVADGSVLISECNEGIEAPAITVSGGTVTVYPTDDGLNANRGLNTFDMFGGFGQTAAGKSEKPNIRISGGSVTVINRDAQDADGIDSNGDIFISGGTVLVSLTNSGSNSALDCGSENGGVMEISGGTVIACGSYQMAESFDSSSTQCSVLYSLSAGADAGTQISLEDADGTVLLSWEVPCSFSAVNLSCPEMKVGETYLLVIGDNAEEITPESVSSSFGNAQSSQFGGPMNWGGLESRENFGRHGGPSGRPADDAMPPPGRPDGKKPDMGGMGPPPDMGGFNGEHPAGNGEAPPSMPASPGEAAIADATAAIADARASVADDRTEKESSVTRMTWILVVAVSVSLLFGILIAAVYKPKI